MKNDNAEKLQKLKAKATLSPEEQDVVDALETLMKAEAALKAKPSTTL